MTAKRKIRCAIYARTSTEEGLSQELNSLDAQIESCRAYIVSQAGEGWIACKQTFVDGGFSGLLSFAQFEREVTAERIRDKFAASKAKGMWMGGPPPLGYNVKDWHLVVNEVEAERVLFIYRRYLELKSINLLAENLFKRGVLSKGWTSLKGLAHSSTRISHGALALILTNPHYRGLIARRDKTYPGRHDAIIDEELWNAL